MKCFIREIEDSGKAVAPARGAWIEISMLCRYLLPGACRPPRGGRGLKYGGDQPRCKDGEVAPREGGVDQNNRRRLLNCCGHIVAPCKEGVN